MNQSERALAALFRELATSIAGDVARRADADGNVPRQATFDLQRLSAERVQRLYLGRNRQGELAPFEIGADGRVIPLAPYPQALWAAISAAVRLSVEENAAILTRRLPDDILDALRKATGNPFQASKRRVVELVDSRQWTVDSRTVSVNGLLPTRGVSTHASGVPSRGLARTVHRPLSTAISELEVFRPNPLANYEAPHTWVDPNGYRLSDRVWNVAATERAKLDLYLDDAIKQGKGALAMSRELEQFLSPSGPGLKTSKPYGTKASFDAMRLARTEISRAHGQAQQVSAAMNPFVAGLKWVVSGRHAKTDDCDRNARGGPNGDGVYPLGEVPRFPNHPNCLCVLLNAMVSDPDAIIDELRRDIRKARIELVDKIGPVQVDAFDRLLLGQILPPAARTREQELADLRHRITLLSDEDARGELTALLASVRAAEDAGNSALADRLREEQRAFVDVLEARRKADEVIRLAAEAQRKAAEAARREREGLTAGEAATELSKISWRFDSELNAAKAGERLYNEATRELSGLYARRDVIIVERLTATDEQKKVLDKEARALNKQIRAFNKQRDDNINATGSRLKIEQRKAKAERAVVYVRDPASNYLQVPATVSASDRQNWSDGMAEFNKLVSRSVWDGNTVDLVKLPTGGRAFARPESYEIHLAPTDEQWIVVHELGHVLEKRAGALPRALAYFDSRTAGDQWEKMSVITGLSTYRDDEVAKKDKWLEPYMGKDYNRSYTEIVSMGVQFMYQKPAEFAREDPGMFEFIYNLLRGALR